MSDSETCVCFGADTQIFGRDRERERREICVLLEVCMCVCERVQHNKENLACNGTT